MKKIDKYILKSFIGPFILTFFIALFILLLQFLWKYLDDLVGKGLEWYVILKLLFYASANLVPLALPIAVLLSSIMLFGNLGERFELAALKSSGVSMLRFMRVIVVATVFITIGAFLFNNYVLPSAYLRFVVTLVDITKQKPALNIKPNEFYNEIDGYSILIGEKSEDDIDIKDVTIYEEDQNQPNNNVLIADSGKMQTSEDKKNLILTLYNGKQYQKLENDPKDRKINQHVRMSFGEWQKSLDLSGFQMTHTSESLYSNQYKMMTVGQLKKAIDSLDVQKVKQESALAPMLKTYYFFKRDSSRSTELNSTPVAGAFLETIPLHDRKNVVSMTLQSVRNISGFTNQAINRMQMTETKITDHQIEWQRKYALSFACFLFLFIGAPLGAIIRKGGFGLPVICSILIFIFYYVINITGERMADEATLTPFFGMWLSVFVIAPFAVFLTMKAKDDSPLMDTEAYSDRFSRIKARLFKIKRNEWTDTKK